MFVHGVAYLEFLERRLSPNSKNERTTQFEELDECSSDTMPRTQTEIRRLLDGDDAASVRAAFDQSTAIQAIFHSRIAGVAPARNQSVPLQYRFTTFRQGFVASLDLGQTFFGKNCYLRRHSTAAIQSVAMETDQCPGSDPSTRPE